MVNNYLRVGGEIRYNSAVEKIILNNKNKAIGVRLKNGEEIFADYIVPACDVHQTFTNFLGGKYLDSHFYKRYKKRSIYPCPTCFLVYYTIPRDILLKELPESRNEVFIKDGFVISGEKHLVLNVRHYGFDEEFIQNDEVLVSTLIPSTTDNYGYWESLRKKSRKDYLDEKNKVVNQIFKIIEEKFPSFKGHIRFLDSVTPATCSRYTGSYKGAYMAFMLKKGGRILLHEGYIKGIKNLVLAGQWTQMPGGLPLALSSGRFAVQRICKLEKKKFLSYKRKRVVYQR